MQFVDERSRTTDTSEHHEEGDNDVELITMIRDAKVNTEGGRTVKQNLDDYLARA